MPVRLDNSAPDFATAFTALLAQKLERHEDAIAAWEQVWAMNSGNASLAAYLAKRLPEDDQAWIALWRETRQRPASMLDSAQLKKDVPIAREIILYAIKRIAGNDEQQAHEKWNAIRKRHDFTAKEAGQIERTIALYAGWRQNPQAHEWLAAVPEIAADAEVREWRVRSAISAGLWQDVLKHIAAMPADERKRLSFLLAANEDHK